MLERVFLPFNRRYKSNTEILDFLYYIIVSLGAPRGHHILYYMYFKEIYARVVKQHISLAGILGMHRGVYRNVINGSLSKQKDHGYSYSKTNFSSFINSKELGFDPFKLFKTNYKLKDCLYIRSKK